jgi:hypothetical protein
VGNDNDEDLITRVFNVSLASAGLCRPRDRTNQKSEVKKQSSWDSNLSKFLTLEIKKKKQ